MAQLAVSKEFLKEFDKLESRHQAALQKQADLFLRLSAQELRNHNGLHLERHTNSADPRARTIRIDDNHRGIVMDTGNDELFILMSIGTHDETDRWMATRTFKVNAATGAFEIHDVEAVEAALSSVPETTGAKPIYDHRVDKDFTQLGVEPGLLPALRAFTSEDQLAAVIDHLVPNQAEVLMELLGDDEVTDIYKVMVGREAADDQEVDLDDVAASLEVPASQSSFRLLDGQDELAEVLSQPLAQWRLFLHPSQRSLVNRPTYNGPVRVTGGAGTGKTVVALHRARHLAESLPSDSGKAVLFTTYTRNLAQSIEHDLRSLGGNDLLAGIDVANIDRISSRIVQEAEGAAPVVAKDDLVLLLWQEVIDDRGLDWSPSFLHSEWEQVILAQNITSRTDYFTASRAGRGVPLGRRSRAAVWKAVEDLTRLLADRKTRTWLQLADTAAGHVARRQIKPYQHVVIDEAQDLHESQWRLVRALVDEGPNDLFLVGDSHQRIYDRKSSLSKVGINIRGRSKKLKLNYRTTHEIMAWSLILLGEGEFDDLDQGTDTHDFAGYHSFRTGPTPTLSGHNTRKEQLAALADQINQWVADGTEEEAIAVAARSKSRSAEGIERALTKAGLQVCVLPTDMPKAVGVRIGTMHRMKGLEFERVAIVDLHDDWFPERAAIATDDPIKAAEDLLRERCLLYVAATRARDELWLGWYSTPTRFLDV